jgi:curved DNA-binding protein CbpA
MTDRATLERLLSWGEVLDDSSYYEILGVLEICDDEAIRAAYHAFALAFHPDLFRNEPEEIQARVRRIFQRGTEAYRVLGDRELRIRYDVGLGHGKRRLQEALAPRRETPSPQKAVAKKRPLDELARSGGAKLTAQKAEKLLQKGEIESAIEALEKALAYDGGANTALQERIEELKLVLFASRR